MWPAVEAVLIVVGVGLWGWAIKRYLDDPGYGGFDMNTAPAFDFRWLRGTLFVAVGVGLLTGSWWLGAAAFLVSTAATMLVKPILGGYAERRISRDARSAGTEQPATGLRALSIAEQHVRAGNGAKSPNEDEEESND